MAIHEGHGEDGAHGATGHGDGGDGDDPIAVRRGDINRIDCTITALLAERMRIGRELGRLKRSRSQPARSETREADVLVRVRAAAARPLSPSSAERIFLTIIEETAACQERDAREENGDV
jgi:chorismate mutase / prephenate dehydratase